MDTVKKLAGSYSPISKCILNKFFDKRKFEFHPEMQTMDIEWRKTTQLTIRTSTNTTFIGIIALATPVIQVVFERAICRLRLGLTSIAQSKHAHNNI